MNILNSGLRAEEKAVFALRSLYEGFGYTKYKVSQFEEYSFYLKYKSFLSSDKFLSFTDLDGRLMALKPDITLSIIKNAGEADLPQKLYYHETVYRESQSTNTFREINQMGLEYIGKIDIYAVCETVLLAKQSLREISDEHVLELSHMGFAEGLFEALDIKSDEKERILSFVSAKSSHEIAEFCENNAIDKTSAEKLCDLCALNGNFGEIILRARQLCENDKMSAALDELQQINGALKAAGESSPRLDFTLLNDTEFYDGVLLAGYISGVPQAVLSGGRYNGMMQKLSKKGGAIGFAVYLSLLEYLREQEPETPFAIIINNNESPALILAAAQGLAMQGKRVLVQESADKISANEIYKFEQGRLIKC